MSSFVGVLVSDQWLQSQFTQVELRALKSKFVTIKNQNGMVTVGDLPPLLAKLNGLHDHMNEEEIRRGLQELHSDLDNEVDFEGFLKLYLELQSRANGKSGKSKHSSSFLKATITTLLHTISQSEKASYVAHINSYLRDDPFLKQFLPIDPSTNALFDLAKDGVLLCKLINVAVPNTIDDRAINTKRVLNPWERNENHTLCLNSAKAIGCTVVNIGTQDLVEARPHLVLGLISQIIKIQLLADLNLRKTPQLLELVEDNNDVEELIGLAPEKVLLKWMNFHLKKAGYKKTVSNFSSDLKDGEAYAYLLNVLAPEHCSPATLDTKDATERANLVLEHAEKMDCKRYLSPKDIVDGSTNLNLAFVAQIFHQRNGLSTDNKKVSFAEMMTDDDLISREERCFRLWINSLGISSYVNNLFEDVRNGWTLLEVLEKISPGTVNWKQATRPPIKMPFRKVENCNQVVRIGKQLKLSLVNVAGNDFVQGNKKLILAFLWQLMRFNMLQLLKNLRSRFQGKEVTDADILSWANRKVKISSRKYKMESFKDKTLSNGLFFLELLSAVEPRVVNWNLVTKGESDEEKKLNATYIISVARKLGCSIFLLPEDIMEVNQKMILTLTASIMYWSLQHVEESESSPATSSRAASPDPGVDQSPTPVTTPISNTEVTSPVPFPSVSSNGSAATPTSTITPSALHINGDSCPIPIPINGSSSPAVSASLEASPISTITPATLHVNGDSCAIPIPMNGSSSPAVSASLEASPAPSASGEDEEDSSVIPEVDDTTADSTMSVKVEAVASDTTTSEPTPENVESDTATSAPIVENVAFDTATSAPVPENVTSDTATSAPVLENEEAHVPCE